MRKERVAPALTDFLERLGRAEDFEASCAALLGYVMEPAPEGRALLLMNQGGEVRAQGWGVPANVVRDAKSSARVPASPEARLMAGHETNAESYRIGNFSPRLFIPFQGNPPDARGVLMMDGLEGEESIAFVEGVLGRFSGLLFHLMELERLRVLEERLATERTFRERMLEAIGDPVLLTDSDSNILAANRRAQELFSHRPDDGDGRGRAVRLNTFLLSTRLTDARIPGRERVSRELNLVDPRDGSDLLFEMRTDRLEGDGKGEERLISVLRDVTELKRASEALDLEYRRARAAEHRVRQDWRRLHTILESVAEPILVTNIQSEIILTNRAAERLFEVRTSESGAEERAPMRWTNVSRFSSFVNDLLIDGSSRSVRKLFLVHPDRGEEFPVEAIGARIEDHQGGATAVVTILRDLTPLVENERLARELKLLNEQLTNRIDEATRELEERNRLLESQRHELEKASHLKSRFLASMSHELRTPINAILGYISLMMEGIYGPLNEAQGGALGKAEQASGQLLDLINEILDLSKIEAGKMPIRPEEVDARELISEVCTTVEPMIRTRPLHLKAEVADGLPTLITDRTKLRQVLLNLAGNAIKFTHEGFVVIRAAPGGDQEVRIEVEDTGLGIPEHELEHVFEDFRQGDQSQARERGGVGLGLSISRKLVSLMGGTLSVDSTVGEGTRFLIRLPIQVEPLGGEDETHRVVLGVPTTPPPPGTAPSGEGSGPEEEPGAAEEEPGPV